MVQVSVSGMETSFALLLITLALLSDLEDRPVPLGLALGTLLLVRPEGVIASAVLLGFRWRRTGRVPWVPALLVLALAAPWLWIATQYYGSPVPHSIPAKAAAYNLHRPSTLPNFLDTLANVMPFRMPWGRLLGNVVLLPCLIAGGIAAARQPRLRPLLALALAWWAYLVLPRTLLFTWYFAPLLLPAYLLAALGLDALRQRPWWTVAPRTAAVGTLGVLAIGLSGWLVEVGQKAARVQGAESTVRRAIGEWLRENTPTDARIAMEPIGYIGYYSGRRILDEVGLVSPAMVPLNRLGDGWFGAMVRNLEPEYIVERPGYLLRNYTLNTGVRMFSTDEDRDTFVSRYGPVVAFSSAEVPRSLLHDYRFVVYARRTPDAERRWRSTWERLSGEEREAKAVLTLSGEALPDQRAARAPDARRRR
jgi:hypothetical protein